MRTLAPVSTALSHALLSTLEADALKAALPSFALVRTVTQLACFAAAVAAAAVSVTFSRALSAPAVVAALHSFAFHAALLHIAEAAIALVSALLSFARGCAVGAGALVATLHALALLCATLHSEEGARAFESALVADAVLGAVSASTALVGSHHLAGWLINEVASIAGLAVIGLGALDKLHAGRTRSFRSRCALPSLAAAGVERGPHLGLHGAIVACFAVAAADDADTRGVSRAVRR
mmetsp:Transcript_73361/g.174852  ORF Transcript_73361/g.174852 Transcript_73361/m.174852 type:complete len:237 (-) Transcript_73361:4100-4810(-)